MPKLEEGGLEGLPFSLFGGVILQHRNVERRRIQGVQELPFRILIDGECPLCKREANMLAKMDRGRGGLVLEDISLPTFDANKYGTTFEAVMGSIHGVLPDGRLVTGVEVFRRAYAAVGYGWLLAWTGWPVVRRIVDAGYVVFAKYRLRVTGRKDACEQGRCKVPV
jgi:predicted DCC family thiol-disulfide oxidoreductase YuxK